MVRPCIRRARLGARGEPHWVAEMVMSSSDIFEFLATETGAGMKRSDSFASLKSRREGQDLRQNHKEVVRTYLYYSAKRLIRC